MSLSGRAAVTLAAAVAALFPLTAAPAAAESPGAVIVVEPRPAGWHGQDRGAVIDYWTSDSAGVARPASGAVFLPEGEAPANGWPVIAYDHGTSGLGPGCGGQSEPDSAPFAASRGSEDALIGSLVDRGYAVVAPDYLGLGRFDTGPHPYLEVATEAGATIDLVRAARAAHPELSRTWTVVGVSQGGHAALSTAHAQAAAAPDLDFRGTVAIDPASDLEKLLPIAGPGTPSLPGLTGPTTGFVVSILAGLRAARPDAQVDTYLTPEGRALVDGATGRCLDAIIRDAGDRTLGDILARPLADGPLPAAIRDYMALPSGGYDAPVLLLLNATDSVVPSPLHGALAVQLAAAGTDVRVVPGTGKHGALDQRMREALHGFVAERNAVPPRR
ncbi:lipase family protein [Nocardia thailandica]|uniref:lipase family protein n=1 Tax=Nocardia thailandica TaxID=257275 RepID=UPI0002DB8D5D|nr:lipase family protein [Nocardia thailandica]